MKYKQHVDKEKIFTCNFCDSIVMTLASNASGIKIYDYETMMICSGCRKNTVGEWK